MQLMDLKQFLPPPAKAATMSVFSEKHFFKVRKIDRRIHSFS